MTGTRRVGDLGRPDPSTQDLFPYQTGFFLGK
jgi:hypothetical protein